MTGELLAVLYVWQGCLWTWHSVLSNSLALLDLVSPFICRERDDLVVGSLCRFLVLELGCKLSLRCAVRDSGIFMSLCASVDQELSIHIFLT